MLSFFPRGVLDEILNLNESVSEDFPSCSYFKGTRRKFCKIVNVPLNISLFFYLYVKYQVDRVSLSQFLRVFFSTLGNKEDTFYSTRYHTNKKVRRYAIFILCLCFGVLCSQKKLFEHDTFM